MAFEKLEASEELVNITLSTFDSFRSFAGKRAVAQLMPYIEGDNPIFTAEELERYSSVRGQQEAEQWLNRRISGHYNNTISIKPGLIALLRGIDVERVEEELRITPQRSFLDPSIEPVVDSAAGDLHILRLPRGGYHVVDPVIKLWDNAVVYAERVHEPGLSEVARIPEIEVVTIIGEGGAYWQNPGFNVDGTSKYEDIV